MIPILTQSSVSLILRICSLEFFDIFRFSEYLHEIDVRQILGKLTYILGIFIAKFGLKWRENSVYTGYSQFNLGSKLWFSGSALKIFLGLHVTHKVMGLVCDHKWGIFTSAWAQSSISLRLRFACNGFFNFFVVAIVVFLSLGFSSNQSVSIWFGSTFIENSHFG